MIGAETRSGADSADRSNEIGVDAFALAFETSPTPMVVSDPRLPDDPIVWANAAYLSLTGYPREELYGRNPRMLQGALSDPEVVARIREAVRARKPIECELFNYRKNGTPYWTGMTISPVRDASGDVIYFFSAQADMTDKQRLEVALLSAKDDLERQVGERTAALRNALDQKTALLHEVDHRVKNNLQVISSLMLLKARRTPEGEARNALQAMADRVGALSTAHRMLYSADDAARFDLREFADDFLADMAASAADRASIHAHIEATAVSAAMASPLALMMHELMTNALRHAFPDDRSGEICVSAARSGNDLSLVIEDNGVGLEAGEPNPAGLGRSLVDMVVRQLKGRVAYTDAAPGTRVEIVIPLERPDERG